MLWKKHSLGSDFYHYVAVLQAEQVLPTDSGGVRRLRLKLADGTTVEHPFTAREYEHCMAALSSGGPVINP